MVMLHSAGLQEQDGPKLVLAHVQKRHPRLKLMWADGGSHVQWLIGWVTSVRAWALEIVKRPEGAKGLVLFPRHWVVERTWGGFNRYPALSKDDAGLPRNSEALVYTTLFHMMVRRLACSSKSVPGVSPAKWSRRKGYTLK
jgi:putative transposase